jgi:hypothetical protein
VVLDETAAVIGGVMKKTLVGLVVVALALVVAVSPAAADTGGYVAGSGYCWDDHDWNYNAYDRRIIATPPTMLPAPDAPSPFATGPGPKQLVGFKVRLLRWVPGTGWTRVQSSTLQLKETNYAWPYGNWYDNDRGTWGDGVTTFYIGLNDGGSYKLLYDLVWYIDGVPSGHVAANAWGQRDDRLSSLTTTGWTYVEWCTYR